MSGAVNRRRSSFPAPVTCLCLTELQPLCIMQSQEEDFMKTLRRFHLILLQFSFVIGFALTGGESAFAQEQAINGANPSRGPGRPVTIPVTINVKDGSEEEL